MTNLQAMFENNPNFKPFISSIVFPNYKNISPGAEMLFNYPLTLLIGKNGTNKSSILHALYGCPDGKSTGEYWFSTHVDPIKGKNKAAFFYRYTIPETGAQAEVLKKMITKPNDPDYWEPSRPVLKDGMQEMPYLEPGTTPPTGRSVTRWNAINKEVIYLDFRAEISAFDKAFYKERGAGSRPEHRAALRRYSKPLKRAIENDRQEHNYQRKERIFINYTFSDEQRSIVNNILGTNYTSIIYIDHDFYKSGSFSVYIKKDDGNKNYSEAFAGSGETSIIRLVYVLSRAPMKALILLDEPETSLHIDAQSKLKDYILKIIREKYLQVVISTHSPFFSKGLPDTAIKILYLDEFSKKIEILNSAASDDSSFYLGSRRIDAHKATVMVEDKLAESILLRVYAEHLQGAVKDKIFIQHYYGGAAQLVKLAANEMLKGNSSLCFLFDGDQKPTQEIPDPETIPPSENNSLEGLIRNLFTFCPEFPVDSNNPQQKIDFMRQFLTFAKARFRYFSFTNPETFISENNVQLLSGFEGNNSKGIIQKYAEAQLSLSGEISASDIHTIQRTLLATIPKENEVFLEAKQILEDFSAFAP